MKTLMLFAFLVALTTVSAHPTENEAMDSLIVLGNVTELCMNTTGLTILDVVEVMQGDARNQEKARKVYCFLACMNKQQGFLVDGKMNKEKIHEIIDANPDLPIGQPNTKDLHHAAVNKCADQVGEVTDECEVAQGFMKCMVKEYVSASLANSGETTTEATGASEEE